MEQQLSVEERRKFWEALDQMHEANEKIGKIYDIIVDDEFGRKGVISRMDSYEKETIQFRNELLTINKRIDRHENFIKGALWVAGIVGGLVGFFINALIKII